MSSSSEGSSFCNSNHAILNKFIRNFIKTEDPKTSSAMLNEEFKEVYIIQSLSDISGIKVNKLTDAVEFNYYVSISGEISHLTKESETHFKTTQGRRGDIYLNYFVLTNDWKTLSEDQTKVEDIINNGLGEKTTDKEGYSTNYDINVAISALVNFSEQFYNFISITTILNNNTSTILKSVSFDTLIAFMISKIKYQQQTLRSKHAFSGEIVTFIKALTYHDFVANVSEYIFRIISDFNNSFLNFPGGNSNHEYIDGGYNFYVFGNNLQDERCQIFNNFSIGKDTKTILFSFGTDFIFAFDMKNKDAQQPKQQVEASGEQPSSHCKLGISVKVGDKTKGNIQNEEQAIFNECKYIYYRSIVKINRYFIRSFSSCCGIKTEETINYSKSPYIFCFDCGMLVCLKCFVYHEMHNYFDICNTLRNKIGNIYSNKKLFLNYANKGNVNNNTAIILHFQQPNTKDHIMETIGNYRNNTFNNRLNNPNLKSKSIIPFCSFHYGDVYGTEYLFKLIHPFKQEENGAYLNDYYINYLVESDFPGLILNELDIDQEHDAEDTISGDDIYQAALTVINNKITAKRKQSLLDQLNYSKDEEEIINEDGEEDLYQITEIKKEKPKFDVAIKSAFTKALKHGNSSTKDLSGPLEENNNYLLSENKSLFKDEEDQIDDDNLLGQYQKTITNKTVEDFIDKYGNPELEKQKICTDWYKIYYNENFGLYTFKFLDGLDSVYPYVIYYGDSVTTEMSNYGFSKWKDEDMDDY